MTKSLIKVVRPWPAEQPRPPIVHRKDCASPAMPEPANTQRQPRTASSAA
jgi:hypothetical protein